jgi:hypothetical protein
LFLFGMQSCDRNHVLIRGGFSAAEAILAGCRHVRAGGVVMSNGGGSLRPG